MEPTNEQIKAAARDLISNLAKLATVANQAGEDVIARTLTGLVMSRQMGLLPKRGTPVSYVVPPSTSSEPYTLFDERKCECGSNI